MDEPFRELARRDAKAIRAGTATACAAVMVAILGLFTPALVGLVAAGLGVFVQSNSLAAWAGGPKLMAERRLVLAPGVVAGIAIALGVYAAYGGVAALIASLPAAALATIVLGMTIAGHRG
jgi:hypothetical protein